MLVTAQLVKELREKTGAGMLDCKKALEKNECDIEKSIVWLRENGILKAAKKADRVAAEGLCNIVVCENEAVVYEINSETDFVAKNDKFLDLMKTIGDALIKSNVKNTEEALELATQGKKIEEHLLAATAVIGEKLTLRRVSRVTKTAGEVFGEYKHQGGKIVALVVTDGSLEVAKDLAMHIAASDPKFLSNETADQAVIANERSIIKNEVINENQKAAKPKPENILEKMIDGRINKFLQEICLGNQAFVKNPDQTVGQYLAQNKAKAICFLRLKVGEGIEKQESDFAAEVMKQVKA